MLNICKKLQGTYEWSDSLSAEICRDSCGSSLHADSVCEPANQVVTMNNFNCFPGLQHVISIENQLICQLFV